MGLAEIETPADGGTRSLDGTDCNIAERLRASNGLSARICVLRRVFVKDSSTHD